MEFCKGNIKELPPAMYDLVIRDILHYNTEEIDKMNFDEYTTALTYSVSTYMQRNLQMVLNNMFKPTKKPKNEKGEISFSVEQPEMMEWLKNHYKEIEEGNTFKVGGKDL
jgi:hypothetical protein